MYTLLITFLYVWYRILITSCMWRVLSSFHFVGIVNCAQNILYVLLSVFTIPFCFWYAVSNIICIYIYMLNSGLYRLFVWSYLLITFWMYGLLYLLHVVYLETSHYVHMVYYTHCNFYAWLPVIFTFWLYGIL